MKLINRFLTFAWSLNTSGLIEALPQNPLLISKHAYLSAALSMVLKFAPTSPPHSQTVSSGCAQLKTQILAFYFLPLNLKQPGNAAGVQCTDEWTPSHLHCCAKSRLKTRRFDLTGRVLFTRHRQKPTASTGHHWVIAAVQPQSISHFAPSHFTHSDSQFPLSTAAASF